MRCIPIRSGGKSPAFWDELYPVSGLRRAQAQVIGRAESMITPFVSLITAHRPQALRGQSLQEAVAIPSRSPRRLSILYEQWIARPELMRDAAPTLVFAVFGRARATGRLSPEQEDQKLGALINLWALQTTPSGAPLSGDWRAGQPLAANQLAIPRRS